MDDKRTMILKEILNLFHSELDTIYGAQEVDSMFHLLTQYYLGFDRLALALDPKIEIDSTKKQHFFDSLKRLKKDEPIQYIIGETEFLGLHFKVNRYTLIPRQETEELVRFMVDSLKLHTKNNRIIRILDVGTGSGCIAISLAKQLPNVEVYAMDVSKQALRVARYNALSNKVNVNFVEADILSFNSEENNYYNLVPELRNLKFDVIVSNPPYVRQSEKSQMKNNVLKYEPEVALFVEDEDPLLFFRRIIEFSVNNLVEKGVLFFEINQYLGGQMKNLLAVHNFKNVELKQDMFGNDRMIKAIKI